MYSSDIVDRYREILVSMMDSVLNKIQLRHNINELREIDDDTVDDDVSSGHQSFRTWFRIPFRTWFRTPFRMWFRTPFRTWFRTTSSHSVPPLPSL